MRFSDTQTKIILDIVAERKRQDKLYGKQRHDDGTWLQIFMEEVGEMAQAMQADKPWGKPTDEGNIYEEVIHSAAVLVAYAEHLREDGHHGKQS